MSVGKHWEPWNMMPLVLTFSRKHASGRSSFRAKLCQCLSPKHVHNPFVKPKFLVKTGQSLSSSCSVWYVYSSTRAQNLYDSMTRQVILGPSPSCFERESCTLWIASYRGISVALQAMGIKHSRLAAEIFTLNLAFSCYLHHSKAKCRLCKQLYCIQQCFF